MTNYEVQDFFHSATATLTYIVSNPATKDAIIIDPVWDFDFSTGKLADDAVAQYRQYLEEKKLRVLAVVESHIHADHISSAQRLKNLYPDIKVGVSSRVKEVMEVFSKTFSETYTLSDFDFVFSDREHLVFGGIEIDIISTPGHTPACTSIKIGEMLFVGDSIFMPDFGTGRCDFPLGSAENLYDSIREKIYTLPESTQIFVGHDYQPGGRELCFQTSVGEQKKKNVHIRADTKKEDFVKFREARDANLPTPKLLLPSIQLNLRAGKLPEQDSAGKSFIKIPLSIKEKHD
tara:strand:+ start:10078 stop:10947 length:870 start_codon:yes stop_codon:yes gene_type:complete